ncbi:GNAT family N-acetyltransferase [Ectothiorhodospiraceae bacterium WFHF3C12]|nr:GNAT family N-acetyltransferase [Ectothiorhodospiraceae bacterium WFHF3C12]
MRHLETGLDRLLALRRAGTAAGHRRLAVLAGNPAWDRHVATALLNASAAERCLAIGEPGTLPIETLPHRQAAAHLGRETDILLYDAWAGFDPDAFGAVTGTVRAGGLAVILTPPLDVWSARADPAANRIAIAGFGPHEIGNRLIGRFLRCLRRDPAAWIWPEASVPPTVTAGPATPPVVPVDDPDCLTCDQARAAALIEAVGGATGEATAVLTADRGRGKSAALGIAAGRIMRRGPCRLVATAPRYGAAAAIFEHAGRVCGDARREAMALRLDGAELEYTAPDTLIGRGQTADLLLVDEAAGIPAPMLESLLRQFPRVVFATTIHGYEGTGRGFAIRFSETLGRLRPDWRALHLEAPIRWRRGDPVERFVGDALLLDAEPDPANAVADSNVAETAYRQLDRDRLADDEPGLRSVFGLLVNAHYRTTPTDLRNLLDGPTTGVHALLWNGHVVAAALTVDEGGFDAALSAAVWLGWRRPHGHLLPQSLTFHGGDPGAAGLRCRRVMRIAVHPACRRRGLGRQLLRHLVAETRSAGMDWLGTSFGATPDLLDFWRNAGFRVLRLGHRREAASGAHAAMMVHPVSPAGRGVASTLADQLSGDLGVLLSGPLRDLETALRRRLPDPRDNAPTASERDWLRAYGFAHGARPLGSDLPALHRVCRGFGWKETVVSDTLARHCLVDLEALDDAVMGLGLEGRKAGEAMLREAVARRLAQADDAPASAGRRYRHMTALAGTVRDAAGYRRTRDGLITAATDNA